MPCRTPKYLYMVYVVYIYGWTDGDAFMSYPKTGKVRRNIYMGQEYLDLEAIVVQERKRTGRNVSVADLVRKACQEYTTKYWTAVATAKTEKAE
jgi:hypothetical protein